MGNERYDVLDYVYHDSLIKGKYIIYESDKKHLRITNLDSETGAIYREECLSFDCLLN